MQPDYKIYVRYDKAASLAELQARVSEYEDIERQRQKIRKAARTDNTQTTVAAAYNKQECCWRCKQRGHTRFDCKRPAKKFCSQCGKDGILTRQCHPPAGNAERTETAATDKDRPDSA
ncbi:cellular nucleic acid binding protein [Lasius niger]|uniref:Cellular nucleic acid binding protein n=1 Tax=Lasius niger TaxID=67767 RepID=A0A0J7KK83_LASNI|nr:cellular nucleic acid binding protein [Lasius niger]